MKLITQLKIVHMRVHFLTHWKIQMRLAFILAGSLIVFLSLLIMAFMNSYMHASLQSDGLQPHDSLVTKVFLMKQAKELLLYSGLCISAYIVCISSFLIIFSHRMTGPVFKLTRLLEKAAYKKEWPRSVRFRKTDAFPELEESFNQFLEAFGSHKKREERTGEKLVSLKKASAGKG